jgi:hypothetical protein
LRSPQAFRTLEFPKGCEDIIGRVAKNITAEFVARLTLNVVLRWDETELCREVGLGTDSGGVDFGGIDEHDWDIVLNGVNAAAVAAFEALAVLMRHNRQLANGADQDVEQISRNHGFAILQRTPLRLAEVSRQSDRR